MLFFFFNQKNKKMLQRWKLGVGEGRAGFLEVGRRAASQRDGIFCHPNTRSDTAGRKMRKRVEKKKKPKTKHVRMMQLRNSSSEMK